MKDLKEVLDKLDSALNELQRITEEVNREKEAVAGRKFKQDEVGNKLKQKEEELNTREAKVKEIESIVAFSNEAKNLMKQAKESMANADERQAKLEKGFKDLGTAQAKFNKDMEDNTIATKKQIEAFQKEKAAFDEKVKIFNTTLSMTKARVK